MNKTVFEGTKSYRKVQLRTYCIIFKYITYYYLVQGSSEIIFEHLKNQIIYIERLYDVNFDIDQNCYKAINGLDEESLLIVKMIEEFASRAKPKSKIKVEKLQIINLVADYHKVDNNSTKDEKSQEAIIILDLVEELLSSKNPYKLIVDNQTRAEYNVKDLSAKLGPEGVDLVGVYLKEKKKFRSKTKYNLRRQVYKIIDKYEDEFNKLFSEHKDKWTQTRLSRTFRDRLKL